MVGTVVRPHSEDQLGSGDRVSEQGYKVVLAAFGRSGVHVKCQMFGNTEQTWGGEEPRWGWRVGEGAGPGGWNKCSLGSPEPDLR